jgi:hypothetical protein
MRPVAKKQVSKYAVKSARAKTAKKRGKRQAMGLDGLSQASPGARDARQPAGSRRGDVRALGMQGNLDSLRDAQPATSRLFQ